MRQTLGTAVFSGMLGVTLFGIFLTPVFYWVIQWYSDHRGAAAAARQAEDESQTPGGHDGDGDGTPPASPNNGEPVHTKGHGQPHTTPHVVH